MMKSAYSIVLTALFLPVVAVRPAVAQSAPLPAEVTRTTDILVGQDKTGPYSLLWKNIRPEGATVTVDGGALAPADYTLDAAAGTVTFRTALKNRSVARVDYGYEPNKAQRNTSALALQPITVSLLNTNGARGSLGLQVTALPGAAENPLLVWGLSGKTGLLGGGLSSELMLSPDTDGKGGGALADRAGVRLGYALTSDRAKIDLSFARAGEGFAPGAGKAFSLADPSERWSLAAQASPAAWISGELKLLGARDLAGKNGATDGSQLALRLLGTNGAPALSFARTEENKQAADGASTGVTTESAGLAGKSGGTTYSLQGQRVATDGPGDKGDVTKENVALSVATASGDKKSQASVALGMNTVDSAAGAEQRQNVELNAKLQPGAATLSVNAQGQRVATDAANKENASLTLAAATKTAQATVAVSGGNVETAKGVDAAGKVEVTAKLQAAPGLTVSAEANKTDNSSQPMEAGKEASSTEVTAGKVNVAAQVGSAVLAVQGQRIVTEGITPEADKTQQNASVALSAGSKDKKALASVSLTGATVETAAGVEARQGVEVKLQPAPMLTLSAETRLQSVTPAEGAAIAGDGTQSVLQTARAELRPVRDTVLTGALRMEENEDHRASITDINAQTQVGGRLLSLSGGWTDREDDGAATALLDTARVRMTLRPVAGISLTGGLTVNPEEKDGKVTEATRREYGLAARVGALDLNGGYALTTLTGPLAVGPQSGELSLQLGLRFSRYTRITGGYKDAFLSGGPELRGERAVSLGLTHDVGSAFNFSLAGTRTEDKAEVGKPTDLKADIKMGLKF